VCFSLFTKKVHSIENNADLGEIHESMRWERNSLLAILMVMVVVLVVVVVDVASG